MPDDERVKDLRRAFRRVAKSLDSLVDAISELAGDDPEAQRVITSCRAGIDQVVAGTRQAIRKIIEAV